MKVDVNANKLRVEYLKLPIQNLSAEFVVRITSPLNISLGVIEAPLLNCLQGLDDIVQLKQAALKRWDSALMECYRLELTSSTKGVLPDKWSKFTIDDVELVECEMTPKAE